MKQKLDNSNISKHLGKSSEYACNYDPTLLVREPRSSNRLHLGLEDHNLPFIGSDTWNGYEITGLTNNGLPVSFVGKFVYSSSSKYIVESKSTKLYFNSFSMTRLGNTVEAVKASIEQMAKKDLTELLETEVGVILYTNESMLAHDLTCDPKGEWHTEWHTDPNTVRSEYITLEDEYPIQDTVFDTYEESPELLEVLDNDVSITRYHSALLRSRCRVTSQPDSGDVYISFTGRKTVDPISLLKYIVSFRDECHFHEEICEAIYKRLYDLLQPETLSVKCLYARRGGWDINPERVSHANLKHYALSDPRCYHIKTPKQ